MKNLPKHKRIPSKPEIAPLNAELIIVMVFSAQFGLLLVLYFLYRGFIGNEEDIKKALRKKKTDAQKTDKAKQLDETNVPLQIELSNRNKKEG